MRQIPTAKLAEIFGPDAALYLTVEEYRAKYMIVSSGVIVAAMSIFGKSYRRVQHTVAEAKNIAARAAIFLRLLRSLHSVWRNEWGSSPAYFAPINAIVVSSIRLLKPHSLSYQDETLTRRPETFVSVASKFDDAGLWL